MAEKLVVSGARGASVAELARVTGNYGVLPTDNDYTALTKLGQALLVENPAFQSTVPGPANSTYTSLASLKAAPVTNASYIFAPPGGTEGSTAAGTFLYQTAGAPYTADGVNIIKLDAVSLSTGALVRQGAASVSAQADPMAAIQPADQTFQFGVRLSYFDQGDTDKAAVFRRAWAYMRANKIGTLIVPRRTPQGGDSWDCSTSIADFDNQPPEGVAIIGEGTVMPVGPTQVPDTGSYIRYVATSGYLVDIDYQLTLPGQSRGGFTFRDLRIGWTKLTAGGLFRFNNAGNYTPVDTDNKAFVRFVGFEGSGWMGYAGTDTGPLLGRIIYGAKLFQWKIDVHWPLGRSNWPIHFVGCDDCRIDSANPTRMKIEGTGTFGSNLIVNTPFLNHGDPDFASEDQYAIYDTANGTKYFVSHIELSGPGPRTKALVYLGGDGTQFYGTNFNGALGANTVPIFHVAGPCRNVQLVNCSILNDSAGQAPSWDEPPDWSFGDVRHDYYVTLIAANDLLEQICYANPRVAARGKPGLASHSNYLRLYPDDVSRTFANGAWPKRVAFQPRAGRLKSPYYGSTAQAPLIRAADDVGQVADGMVFYLPVGSGRFVFGQSIAGKDFPVGAKIRVYARVKSSTTTSWDFIALKNGAFLTSISNCQTGGVWREDSTSSAIDTTGWSNGDTINFRITEGGGNDGDLRVEYYGWENVT